MSEKLEILDGSNSIKPFWSWNDKLEKEELVSQIKDMKAADIGGFFMHARGGLITEYMSDEWFSCVEACLDKSKEMGMQAWAYDENGWPSGFANGIVPKIGEDFQQKRLIISKYGESEPPPHIIAYYRMENDGFLRIYTPEKDCIIIGYDINIYYVDTFNPEAIRAFIKNTHQKYYERFADRFGKDLKGFFTDEPQYGGNARIPWSQVMPEIFKSIYGYELVDILPYLYYDVGDFSAYRADFYNFVSMQFNRAFIKQMYDWCHDHNCMLTGHVMNEHTLSAQMASTAGAMPCYEFFHEPGIDWLGRKISSPMTPKQLGSVAAQLGKKTLTETFALCGWDVSLNELKWIAQWQYVNGVTSLCPHLEGYSMKGCRKRDYPASLFTQLPWFKDAYPLFSRYFTRLGTLLDSGVENASVLVIHMLQSAYTSYNPNDMTELKNREYSFDKTVRQLNDNHIPHHYGDESIISHYGEVSDKQFIIGKCRYKAVFLSELTNIKATTLKLLKEFLLSGGRIIYMGEFPAMVDGRKSSEIESIKEASIKVDSIAEIRNVLTDLNFISVSNGAAQKHEIHTMHRFLDDGRELLYLVNLTDKEQSSEISICGKYNIYESNIIDEELSSVGAKYLENSTKLNVTFAPYGSFVYILNKNTDNSLNVKNEKYQEIKLENNFVIDACEDNALTLDYCEYRVNGGEWQEPCPIIALQKRLINLKRNCEIEMRFSFHIDNDDFTRLFLCIETPERYTFEINGKKFSFDDCGSFIDHSIRRCNLKNYVSVGTNCILIKGEFSQNENVYRVLFTPGIHEVEKNKLTYDTELESIYIIGDFGVSMAGRYHYGERRCIYAGREFNITSLPQTVDIRKITESGFWFFSGKIRLSQQIVFNKCENTQYVMKLLKLNAPAAKLFVNGYFAGIFAFAPYRIEITKLLNNGSNEITLELLSGNRNLLGPHHKPYGESYSVGPSTFTDELGWTDAPGTKPWTDNYNFVIFGAEI